MSSTTSTDRENYYGATEIARDMICGDCRGELVARFYRSDPDGDGDAAAGQYRAVCAAHPDEHASIASRRQDAAAEIRERLERTDPRVVQSLALSGARVPLTTQAIRALDDRALVNRAGLVRFAHGSQLTPVLQREIAALARTYGLDPLFDLMIYEGRPYVTHDGRLRKLRENPQLEAPKTRPLTPDEKTAWGWETDDIVVECVIRHRGGRGEYIDFGVVRRDEITRARQRATERDRKTAPVGTHPVEIAIKRAIGRCSRQAAGIDLPTWDDATGGPVIDVTVVEPSGGVIIEAAHITRGEDGSVTVHHPDRQEPATPDSEPPPDDDLPPGWDDPPVVADDDADAVAFAADVADGATDDMLDAREALERIRAGEQLPRGVLWSVVRELAEQAAAIGIPTRVAAVASTDSQLGVWIRGADKLIRERNRQLDERAAAEPAAPPARAGRRS